MSATQHSRWLPTAILVGLVYFATGHVFGALAGSAGPGQARTVWRLAAWVVSAIAFTVHIRYEHVQLRSVPTATAGHTSLAVAIGAFALAVAATVHGMVAHHHFPSWALLVFPVGAATPAFVLALLAALLLTRMRRDDNPDFHD
jgi:hypothetical protein